MYNWLKVASLGLFVLALLTSCATQEELNYLRYEVATLDEQVGNQKVMIAILALINIVLLVAMGYLIHQQSRKGDQTERPLSAPGDRTQENLQVIRRLLEELKDKNQGTPTSVDDSRL